jgi:hypothetical protein
MKTPILIVTIVIMLTGILTIDPIPSGAEQFRAGSPGMAGVMIGKQVRNEQGAVLGVVENIVLNDTGCAQFVVISGKFHGARARLYPIPWTIIARTAPDAIFVNVDPAFLAQAPSFEQRRWVDFSQPKFQTEVRTFFEKRAHGFTPGQAAKPQAQVSPEERAKGEKELKERQKALSEDKAKAEKELKAKREGKWERPASEGVTSEQKAKEKHALDKQRERKSTEEMSKPGAVQSQKQKEMSVKEKEQKPEAGMMERGKSMMERGKSMMNQEKSGMQEQGKQMMGQEKPMTPAPEKTRSPDQEKH